MEANFRKGGVVQKAKLFGCLKDRRPRPTLTEVAYSRIMYVSSRSVYLSPFLALALQTCFDNRQTVGPLIVHVYVKIATNDRPQSQVLGKVRTLAQVETSGME